MTPSQQCKAAGLKSLTELSTISKVSPQTLINWHRDKPTLFALVIAGAVNNRLRLVAVVADSFQVVTEDGGIPIMMETKVLQAMEQPKDSI